jgi:hypothetical protein
MAAQRGPSGSTHRAARWSVTSRQSGSPPWASRPSLMIAEGRLAEPVRADGTAFRTSDCVRTRTRAANRPSVITASALTRATSAAFLFVVRPAPHLKSELSVICLLSSDFPRTFRLVRPSIPVMVASSPPQRGFAARALLKPLPTGMLMRCPPDHHCGSIGNQVVVSEWLQRQPMDPGRTEARPLANPLTAGRGDQGDAVFKLVVRGS